MRVDYTTYQSATGQEIEWAKAGEHRAVSLSCVTNVMESYHHFLSLFAWQPLTQPSHQVSSPRQQEG